MFNDDFIELISLILKFLWVFQDYRNPIRFYDST